MDTQFYKKMFKLSLNHKMQFNPDWYEKEIKEYITVIDTYNAFNSKKVLDMLEKIDSIIPRRYYNENNPNNGNRLYTIEIGREYSPVIYINIETKTLGKNNFNPELLPIITEEIENTAKKALADEISHEMINSDDQNTPENYSWSELKFRIWYD